MVEPTSPLLTGAEACAALKVSRSTLYRLVAAGLVTRVRIGARSVRYPQSSISAYAERNDTSPPPEQGDGLT